MLFSNVLVIFSAIEPGVNSVPITTKTIEKIIKNAKKVLNQELGRLPSFFSPTWSQSFSLIDEICIVQKL